MRNGAQRMTCARADDVTARAVSRLFSLVEFQRRVFWGKERSSRYFLYLHTHHTHFNTVWLSDRLISVLFSPITAILVRLFWRLPPEISAAAASLRRICGVHSDLSECVLVFGIYLKLLPFSCLPLFLCLYLSLAAKNTLDLHIMVL